MCDVNTFCQVNKQIFSGGKAACKLPQKLEILGDFDYEHEKSLFILLTCCGDLFCNENGTFEFYFRYDLKDMLYFL